MIFWEAEHWRNTSSILMAWEKAGRCQAPVKQNMDFSLQTICMTYNGVGGPDKEGPIPGSSKHGQWCSTCLLWVTVIEIHLRTSIAVSASQASWQVADLQSCSMMHIRVRVGEREEIQKKYVALSQPQGERAGSVSYTYSTFHTHVCLDVGTYIIHLIH